MSRSGFPLAPSAMASSATTAPTETAAQTASGPNDVGRAKPGHGAGTPRHTVADPPPARALRLLAAGCYVIGIVLAAWPRGALWLDEAQSLSIARARSVGLVDGLRADGAPPLYYVLLRGWTDVFGTGNLSVRWLSTLIAAVGIAVLGAATARVAGRTAGLVALAIASTHPYAIRYGSETRMYALVMLEVSLGVLLCEQVVRRPDRRRLMAVALALTTAALLYTHYWGIHLVAASACCLLILGLSARSDVRRGAFIAVSAQAVGALLWVPWIPVLLYQSAHTGTPWTSPPELVSALHVTIHRDIGDSVTAALLSTVIACLVGIGLAASLLCLRRSFRRRLGDPPAAASLVAAVLALTFVLSFLAARVSDSAFVARYTMNTFPLTVLVAAAVLSRAGRHAFVTASVAGIAGLSIWLSATQINDPRTRAPMFAEVLARDAAAGDVVAYCPDQLGPSVVRLLDRDHRAELTEWTFPFKTAPDRVDWVDYRERHLRASALGFAEDASAAAGREGAVWLVVSTTYPSTQRACSSLLAELTTIREPHQVIAEDPGGDHDAMWRFDAVPPAGVRR